MKHTGLIQLAADGSAPSEILIWPYGEVEFVDGRTPVIVDEAGMDAAVAAFEAHGLDLPVDYEHQSSGGKFAAPDGKAPAAGWIKRLVNKGKDGLWAAVEWTATGAKLVSSKEYRYTSPEYYYAAGTRRLEEIVSLALVNKPATANSAPLVAAAINSKEDENMEEFLQSLITLLGLAETATAEDVIAKVKDLMGAQAGAAEAAAAHDRESAELREALGVPAEADASTVKAHALALKQGKLGESELAREVASLRTEVAGARERESRREAGYAVEAAIAEGKLFPAQREWALGYAAADPKGFSEFVTRAPEVVPVADRGMVSGNAAARQRKGDKPAKPWDGDEAARETIRKLGHDPDTLEP